MAASWMLKQIFSGVADKYGAADYKALADRMRKASVWGLGLIALLLAVALWLYIDIVSDANLLIFDSVKRDSDPKFVFAILTALLAFIAAGTGTTIGIGSVAADRLERMQPNYPVPRWNPFPTEPIRSARPVDTS